MAIPPKKFTEENAIALYRTIRAKAPESRAPAEQEFYDKVTKSKQGIRTAWDSNNNPVFDPSTFNQLKSSHTQAANVGIYQSKGKASLGKKISYTFSKNDMANNKYLKPVKGGGATGALHIPQYKRAISPMNRYIWLRTLHRHKRTFKQFQSFRWDHMPVDGFDNISNVIKSVDKLFEKTNLHHKFKELNTSVADLAIQVNTRVDGKPFRLDDAKSAAAEKLAEFSKNNAPTLELFKADVAEIKAAVALWEPPKYRDGSEKGSMRQAVTSKHKEAMNSYLEDMENIANGFQDLDTCDILEVINDAEDQKDLSLALNRINAIGADTELRLKHFSGTRQAIEEHEGLARMLVQGVYPTGRNTERSQVLQVKANYESLLDVNAVNVPDKMEGKTDEKWGPADNVELANTLASLVKNNLLHEALYIVDEIKLRAGYPNPNSYRDGWIPELENILTGKGNEAWEEAYKDLETAGSKQARDGGGVPAKLWRAFNIPYIAPLMGKRGAGKREVQEFCAHESFYWRIFNRFKGKDFISNPAHGMGIGHLKVKAMDAAKYELGGFDYKKGPKKGERSDEYAFIGVDPNYTKDEDGQKTKIKKTDENYTSTPNTIIPWYHRKPMFLARIASRWSGVAPAWTLPMRYFGNAIIAANLFVLPAAHLLEEGVECIPVVGDIVKDWDVASRLLGGEIWVADKIAWAGSQVGDGARWAAGSLVNAAIPDDLEIEAFGYTFDPELDEGVLWGEKTDIHDYTGAVFEWAHHFNQNVIGDRGDADVVKDTIQFVQDKVDSTTEITNNVFDSNLDSPEIADILPESISSEDGSSSNAPPSNDDNASVADADDGTTSFEDETLAEREARMDRIVNPKEPKIEKWKRNIENGTRDIVGDKAVNNAKKGFGEAAQTSGSWIAKTRDHLRSPDGDALRAPASLVLGALSMFPLSWVFINRISGTKDPQTGKKKGFVNKTLKLTAIVGMTVAAWAYLNVDPAAPSTNDGKGKDKQEQKSRTPKKITSAGSFNSKAAGDTLSDGDFGELNKAVVAFEAMEATFVQGGNNFLPANGISVAQMDFISSDGETSIPYKAASSGFGAGNNGPDHALS